MLSYTILTPLGTDAFPFNVQGHYRHTQDLLALESHQPPTKEATPIALTQITTPLNSEAWQACLQDHPDKDFANYILKGISQGFHIGCNRAARLQSAKGNMSSAKEHADIIRDYLDKESKEARVCGPLPGSAIPGLHISPLGIIPKPHKPKKWRLIVDMSSPEGTSVNDGIAKELATLSYISIQDVAREIVELGKGTLLAKIDIKSAYRVVPVHPEDRPLLGMKFQARTYADATLPFGLRSAPKIFNAVADALLWILKTHGVSNIMHYLDDFITLGTPGSSQCESNRLIMSGLCELLGMPLAVDKCEGPTTLLGFLGFLLDTNNMTVSLPQEKLDRIASLIHKWLDRRSCTKSELESLIGQLQHASTVVKPGRSFLRRMIILAKARRNPSHYIRLNQSFRADLMWWHMFLRDWNGTSLMSALGRTEPTFTLASDASGSWGCGAFFRSHWFQLPWTPAARSFSIAFQELVPILIAGMLWGGKWANCQVRALCDNQAVVAVIRARYCRDDNLMHLLRCLFFVEAKHSFTIVPEHIPGKHNDLADRLSRNRISPSQLQDLSLDPQPETIPLEASTVLLDPKLDWLSQAWTDSFNSILTKV